MKVKNIEESPSGSDKIKWILVGILLLGGLVLNYYFGQVAVAIQVIGWLVLIAAVAAIGVTTEKGKALLEFARESRTELRKVVWPTRQETVNTTLLVIALVVVMSIFLWGIDSFLLWVVSWLTGQRG